jgi:predicted dehydrogenase
MTASREVIVGIIGAGFMGTLYGRIYHQMEGVSVAAVLDIDSQRANSLAGELGAKPYIGEDYAGMIKAHPELDAVIVTTPENSHVDPALAVIQAEKHIFLDKPLAASTEDALVILDAIKGKNLISMMAYTLRFAPRYAAVKTAVENGNVGKVIHIVARRNVPSPVLERIKARVESPFWVGVHDIDMMRWVSGSDVKRVMAMVTKQGFEEWNIKGSYFALLEFENGVLAFLENSWTPTVLAGRAEPYIFKVEGTKGQVHVRGYDSGVTVYTEDSVIEPDTLWMPTSFGKLTGAYYNQMAYFADCVRQGKQTDIPLGEGLNGVMAAEAIIRSAESRQEVVLGA